MHVSRARLCKRKSLKTLNKIVSATTDHFLKNHPISFSVIPWCSPLSLRALIYSEPFYPDYILDNKSGVIKKDRNSRTKTVRSRIDDLWTHVQERRKDFESKPDTGLLPKSVTRHIHKFVNYVVKGFIGTIIILLTLPMAMAISSTLSIFLALMSPAFVWIGSALFHLICFLFFDIEGNDPIGKKNIFHVSVLPTFNNIFFSQLLSFGTL